MNTSRSIPRVKTVELPSYLRSIGGALVLELLILGIAGAVLMHKHDVVVKEPIMLAIEEPVLDKPKDAPKPPEPKVKMKPMVLPHPQPVTPPPPQPVPPEVKPQENLPPDPAFAQHVEPPKPPPPPPIDESALQKAQADFVARIRAAIQVRADMLYPQSARLMGVEGRTRVHFSLHDDGTVSEVRMLVSSGNAAIDKAAVAAVSSAGYPIPPKDLRGKYTDNDLWVEFTLKHSN